MKKLFGLMIVAVILYYWPYTHQSFLIWDDEAILSRYKYFNPVNIENFFKLWVQPYNGLYTPVLKSLWAAVISVLQITVGYDWGEKNVTLPFILINILLHAGNTLLVYKVTEKIFGFLGKTTLTPAGIFVALGFYAFHPLQIENLNWIMGTKELLWIHFALWSLVFYFRGSVAGTLLCYFLAILSKPTAIIMIPLFGFLLFLKKENFFQRRNLILLVPATVAGLLLVLWTEKMQPSTYAATVPEKLAGAIDTFGFYITKIIWPFPLSADYGRHYQWLQAQGWTWAQLIFVLAAAGCCALFYYLPVQRRFIALMAALFFLPLLTTSGIIGLSFQTYSNVADHYASFSLIPVTMILALAFSYLKKPWLLSLGAVYTLIMAAFGWNYKTAWAENRTLFQHILSVNSNSFMAYNNLGLVAAREGQTSAAVKYYEEARKIKPEFTQPLLNLFVLQTKLRNFDYLKSLSSEIDFAAFNDHQLYFEYAAYLQASGQTAGAESAYLKAIELRPREASYYYRLAALYLSMQNIEKAKIYFKQAAELDPANRTYRDMSEQIQKL